MVAVDNFADELIICVCVVTRTQKCRTIGWRGVGVERCETGWEGVVWWLSPA